MKFLFSRKIIPQAKFVFKGKLTINVNLSAMVALLIGWFVVRRLIRKLL